MIAQAKRRGDGRAGQVRVDAASFVLIEIAGSDLLHQPVLRAEELRSVNGTGHTAGRWRTCRPRMIRELCQDVPSAIDASNRGNTEWRNSHEQGYVLIREGRTLWVTVDEDVLAVGVNFSSWGL